MQPTPETTLVIVLGASQFPNLPAHMSNPAFRKSAEEFRRYLLDRDGFGLSYRNLLDLFDNPAGPLALDDLVVQFLQRRMKELQGARTPATDLIVYYVGHGGFFPPHDQYFLALAATRAGNEAISGYPIHALAATLREHTAWLRRYLILDCCFSAAAYQAFQGSGPMEVAWRKTEQVLPARGTALLCAASLQDPAKAPAGQDHTMFSGALLEVLRKGSPDLPERLSLAQLGECATELIQKRFADKAVRPEIHSPDQKKGDPAKAPLFPNHGLARKLPEEARPPPEGDGKHQDGPHPSPRIPRAVKVVAAVVAAVMLLLAVGYFTGILSYWVPLTEEDLIRQSVKPRARMDRKVLGKNAQDQRIYNNWFWIEAPPEIMDKIERVVYDIPKEWGGPYIGDLRSIGFRAGYIGIGLWSPDMDVIVVLRDGRRIPIRFNMYKEGHGK
jgi:hypothetical protein